MNAFDFAKLVERLKSKGLEATEELAKIVVGEVLDWTSESLAAHPTAAVKFLAPLPAMLKPIALEAADKINPHG